MEDEWIADRARLRQLWRDHPTWRIMDFAAALHRSVGWVVKWLRRFQTAAADDDTVLASQSRAPKHPPLGLSLLVMTAILTIRLHPPQNLRRIPGPKAILYYLRQDPALAHETLPRSTRTVYRVLKAAGLIAARPRRWHEPVERPAPLTVWELDFKDNTCAQRDADGKQQHMIEVLVTIDTGTSILLDLAVRDDFTAETALLAMADLVQRQGLPQRVRFDRDPRLVGSAQQGDFPSAVVRFWLCLGVQVDICDPHRPQDKGFVERVNRTLDEECLQPEHPVDLGQTRMATTTFLQQYNEERPNQAITCQNQPPRVAWPDLPTLPRVPERVDPDAWLHTIDGLRLTRKAGKDGRIAVDKQYYYVGTAYRGQRVGLQVDATAREVIVEHQGRVVKRVSLKGLRACGPLPFGDWVDQVRQEAVAEQRRQRIPRGRGSETRTTASWMTTLKAAVTQVRAAEQRATARSPETAAQPILPRVVDDPEDIPF